MKIKKEYDNYEIMINKLSRLLDNKGFVIIQNTRPKSSFNANRNCIEKVLGDMRYSELNDIYTILGNILGKETEE